MTSSADKFFQRASVALLACHLVEILLTIWLLNDLWTNSRTASLVAMATIVVAANAATGLVSFVWVARQLTFGDRCVGRWLCYVLHLVGGFLFWRGCKLALAFDQRDVGELATLRHALVHLQTLPVCLLQVASCYQSLTGLDLARACVVIVLLVSGVTTLTLFRTLDTRQLTGLEVTAACDAHAKSQPNKAHSDVVWRHLLVAVQTASLLWSRLMALATAASCWPRWVLAALLAQFGGATMVACLAARLQPPPHSTASKLNVSVQSIFAGYMLLFDCSALSWQPLQRFFQRPVWLCAYYVIVGVQGAIYLSLWATFALHSPHLKLATVAASLTTFCVGVVILAIMRYSGEETALQTSSTDVGSENVSANVLPSIVVCGVDRNQLPAISAAQQEENVYCEAEAGGALREQPFLLGPCTRSLTTNDSHSANSRNTNTLGEAETLAHCETTICPSMCAILQRDNVHPPSANQRRVCCHVTPSGRSQCDVTALRPHFQASNTQSYCTGAAMTTHHDAFLAASSAGYLSDSEPDSRTEGGSCATYTTWPRATPRDVLASVLPPRVSAPEYVRAWLQYSQEPLDALRSPQPCHYKCQHQNHCSGQICNAHSAIYTGLSDCKVNSKPYAAHTPTRAPRVEFSQAFTFGNKAGEDVRPPPAANVRQICQVSADFSSRTRAKFTTKPPAYLLQSVLAYV